MNKPVNKIIIFFIFLIFPVLNSCKSQVNTNDKISNKSKENFKSIDVERLIIDLHNADKKLIPKIKIASNGSSYYEYYRILGEEDPTIDELIKRRKIGTDFYLDDRQNIKKLLEKIKDLEINNQIINIDNETLGLWNPSKNLMLINKKVINEGSSFFLNVLQHEAIHIAQSCFNKSKISSPKRIGLPLEFSKDLNLNLSHKLYSKNTKEGINIEREAFTYEKIDGLAYKLLKKFCY